MQERTASLDTRLEASVAAHAAAERAAEDLAEQLKGSRAAAAQLLSSTKAEMADKLAAVKAAAAKQAAKDERQVAAAEEAVKLADERLAAIQERAQLAEVGPCIEAVALRPSKGAHHQGSVSTHSIAEAVQAAAARGTSHMACDPCSCVCKSAGAWKRSARSWPRSAQRCARTCPRLVAALLAIHPIVGKWEIVPVPICPSPDIKGKVHAQCDAPCTNIHRHGIMVHDGVRCYRTVRMQRRRRHSSRRR
jgi:hypothetical protein